jgi:hypothetical protein
MNGYIAMYRGKKIEVQAETSYEAQQKAVAIFKAKKSFDVSVYLCEKEGEKCLTTQTM